MGISPVARQTRKGPYGGNISSSQCIFGKRLQFSVVNYLPIVALLFFINPTSTFARIILIDQASIRQEFLSSIQLLFNQELVFINITFI